MSELEQFTVAVAERYAVERELGRGGMATVYLARDLKHDRQVAIKVMRPEIASALNAERFLREIAVAGRLQHPNIVMLLDSGQADGLLYYVMPYVEGESLAERLERDRQLPIEDAVAIAQDVASALGYAHDHGVIHRDIKPDNIMLTGGHAVVVDFGIGKALEAESEKLTQTGMSLGTPTYMSPEQALGERDIDGRADVYALGSVLYEMLVGEPPYTGVTLQAIIAKRSSDQIPSARRIRDTIPPGLDAAIKAALATDPGARIATAEAFTTALTRGVASGASPAPGVVRKRLTPRRLLAMVSVVTLLGVAVVLGVKLLARSGIPDRVTLAILPFQTVGVAEDEFFAEGMKVELADRLSRLSGVSVVARSGAALAVAAGMSPREMGRKLGADYLLSGTIRWRKDSDGITRVRITPQLVRTADEKRVWGQPYEEDFADVFTLQADIAERVAEALDITLVAGEEDELRRVPTTNLAAWQEYAVGRAYFARVDGATAVPYYKRAIELDPDFALAYAGLADAYHFSTHSHRGGFLDQRLENWARGEQAARRALALDSTLGAAHVSLGSIYMFRDFDWERAEESIKRGLAIDPDYAQGHSRYRNLLHAMGRHDSALAEAQRAVALDPLSPLFNNNLGLSLVMAGHTDEGFQQFEHVQQIAPSNRAMYLHRAYANIRVGDWEAVRRDLAEFGFPPPLLEVWYAAVLDSQEVPALRAHLEALELWKLEDISVALGFLVPATGDNQLAIDMIEMAVKDRAGDAIVGIDLVPLKHEPRFQALRREMGLE